MRYLVLAIACTGLGLALLTSGATASEKRTSSVQRTSRIAFARYDDPNPLSLFTANPDGSGLKPLTPGIYGGWPVWSPGGRRIVFERSNGPDWDIAVVNADGTGLRSLAHHGIYPDWSPSGKRIVFWSQTTPRNGIVVMNADGTGRRVLTHNGAFPSWSPDGTKIMFARSPTEQEQAALYVMNPDGTGQHLLRRNFQYGVWSPSGARIAALHNAHLWVLTADGRHAREIAHTYVPFKMSDCSFAWSPDGRQLALTARRQGGVTRVNVRTGRVNEVPGTGPGACGVSWAR